MSTYLVKIYFQNWGVFNSEPSKNHSPRSQILKRPENRHFFYFPLINALSSSQILVNQLIEISKLIEVGQIFQMKRQQLGKQLEKQVDYWVWVLMNLKLFPSQV